MNAEVCTARRDRDGAPCWLRVHVGKTHLTEGLEWFAEPDQRWTNVNLRGDELRDAPAPLR